MTIYNKLQVMGKIKIMIMDERWQNIQMKLHI